MLPIQDHPNGISFYIRVQPKSSRRRIEGMQGDIQFLRKAFPDFNLTIEEMVEANDKVWVRMTARGTNRGGFMGPPNGKSFEVAVFDECRFEEGRIVEHWGAPDRLAVLAQLGLPPQRQQAKV